MLDRLQQIVWGCCLTTILLLSAPRALTAQVCTVATPSDTTISRNIELDVNCPGAPFFKLSESAAYRESPDTGVQVRIDATDPAKNYVDLSIHYPNGITGANGSPFMIADTEREVRILAVLFDFSDGVNTRPDYASPTWVNKLVFGGDHDGNGQANSVKAHIEQNTYGTVKVTGEVYPTWANVSPIETYRSLNQGPTSERRFADEIVQDLIDKDPGFFTGKDFDFLIALTPGGLAATTVQPYSLYSNWSDPNGIFEGWAMFDIPVDSGSDVYAPIVDEQRESTTNTIVVPQYNPQSVEGVWLASDAAHNGTNFFTGGRVRYDISNPNYFSQFIELGTPLPEPNTAVIVSYKPRAYKRLSDEQLLNAPADSMPDTSWFGLVVHELYHGAGWLLNPTGQSILDMYQSPMELIGNYGIMAQGLWNKHDIDGTSNYVPGDLSAYSKASLDIVKPYTLRYGENETGLRLYRSEEGEHSGTNERAKMIKVPLHSGQDTGQRLLVDSYGNERGFNGEEYLLLEWRQTSGIPSGAFNFDTALPHSGLVIYRVIDGNSDRHGDDHANVVSIVDATPAEFPFVSLNAFNAQQVFSLELSAAPFGSASGVYEYIAGDTWNSKSAASATTGFELSAGEGQKTVYVKFMDLNGQLVDESSVTVSLSVTDDTPPSDDTPPAVNVAPVANAGENRTVITADGSVSVVLDGTQSLDADGSIVDYIWKESDSIIASSATASVILTAGSHTITLSVVDDEGDSNSDVITVEVVNQATTDDGIAAPTNLSATVSQHLVSLNWQDNASNESGYQVERGVKLKKNEVQFSVLATTGANFTDHYVELVPGHYYFRVKVLGTDGEALESSNIVKIRITGGGNS